MKKSLILFLKTIFNKYVIAIVIFVFIMLTNEQYNVRTRYKNKETIEKLEYQIRFYKLETKKNKEKLQLLQSDKDNLEKFAREQYMMKKSNEDIFVVVE